MVSIVGNECIESVLVLGRWRRTAQCVVLYHQVSAAYGHRSSIIMLTFPY